MSSTITDTCPSSKQKKLSQPERIYNLLSSADGGWVPAVELSKISLAYGRCVWSLRRDGALIENKTVSQPGGGKHGFFRLLQRRPEHSAHIELWQGSPLPEQATLLTAQPKPVAGWHGDPEQGANRRRA